MKRISTLFVIATLFVASLFAEHEYVDLGLSVNWATCNVGATSPEEYGDYFAWGETEPKEYYDWSTYKYGTGYYEMTKYCNRSDFGKDGFIDNKTRLDSEDDAATVNWGGSWRIPTSDEMAELKTQCTWTWITQNGVNGYLVTSNVEGYTNRSIFFPAAGSICSGNTVSSAGEKGIYWLDSLESLPVSPGKLYFLSDFIANNAIGYCLMRESGHPIRPVCPKPTIIASGTCGYYSWDNLTWELTSDSVLTISGTGRMYDFYSSKENSWDSYKSSIKSVIINEGANSVGAYAFAGCTSLISITIPNSVTSIGFYAFSGCTGLTTITIPKGVTSIDDCAFWGCTGLTSITMEAIIPPTIDSYTFYSVSKTIPVTVPCGSLTAYQSAEYCSEFTNLRGLFPYTFSATTADANMGGVTIETEPACGVDAVIKATPKTGYAFEKWSDGNTTNPRTIIVTEDITLTAEFIFNNYEVKLNVTSNGNGTVTGEGIYNYGSQATLIATPNAGYVFEKWSDGNTDNPRTITVTEDNVYTAYFKIKPGVDNGHEYVDLGLSVKWATCNIGANSPEEYGDYFAWGEIEPKEKYDMDTYKHGENYNYTKYCDKGYGILDNRKTLELEDDAATANWGGMWRIPTMDELLELETRCTWTWTTQNGVDGYDVVGPNGNSIFLPAAGYRYSEYIYAGENGSYWSSSLYNEYPDIPSSDQAYSLWFDSSRLFGWGEMRTDGKTIRAVQGKDSTLHKQHNIAVSSSDTTQGVVSGGGLYYKNTRIVIKATAKEGYRFVKWSDGNTNYYRNITVTKDASYIAIFEEKTTINHEYVDLGLSVKWATCNIGADYPEDYGDYFAWGETEPKEYYDWTTYKYGSDYKKLTKYCNDSSYGFNGFVDNKKVLDREDDAAFVNWGSAWRMPTIEEFVELIENCTWLWASQNGVIGYRVIGPNGNSIFLPAAGMKYKNNFWNATSNGYYWSLSLDTEHTKNSGNSVYFSLESISWIISGTRRINGQSIRPVYKGSTITTKSNNNNYGTVSGGGTYGEGIDVTLTATPKEGYHFVKWSDGNTDNPRIITVTEDISITAEFAINTYDVIISAENGVVIGTGKYNYGAQATITATPNNGYRFVKWSDGNTDNPRTITVTEDISLTAEFEKLPSKCYVSVQPNNPAMGMVMFTTGTNNAECEVGAIVAFVAITNSGYSFKGWSDGVKDVFRTIVVTQDTTIVAQFEAPIVNYTLTLTTDNTMGTVFGAGTYTQGTNVTIVATPKVGYRFVKWSDGNTNATRTITVNANMSLSAEFEAIPTYTVTITTNTQMGSVSGGGTFEVGKTTTISAVANDGYKFKKWSDGNTANPRTITVNQNISLEAIFEALYVNWSPGDNESSHTFVDKHYYDTITITAGKTIIVEDKATIACNDIVIKADKNGNVPDIKVVGDIIANNGVTYKWEIDDTRWYFFSLPFNCKISDIKIETIANGPKDGVWNYYNSNNGSGDFIIRQYNQKNASNGQGKKTGWEDCKDNNMLHKGRGYIIGLLPAGSKAKVMFKSEKQELLSKLIEQELDFGNDHSWYDYKEGDNTLYNGWNLVGIPYFEVFSQGNLDAAYVSIPNEDATTYLQYPLSEALDKGLLRPFMSFFIQLGQNEAPIFNPNDRSNAPMLRSLKHSADGNVVVNIHNAEDELLTDKTTIINNKSKTNEYEIGYDLQKMIGYAALPQIYTIEDCGLLAFNAQDVMASGIVRLGLYVPTAGEYVISGESWGAMSGAELYDNETYKSMPLTIPQTVYFDKGTYNGRFEIRVKQNVTTKEETIDSDLDLFIENGRLIVDNMPANGNIFVYDMSGKLIHQQTTNSIVNIDLISEGVYNITICTDDNQVITRKIIF